MAQNVQTGQQFAITAQPTQSQPQGVVGVHPAFISY